VPRPNKDFRKSKIKNWQSGIAQNQLITYAAALNFLFSLCHKNLKTLENEKD
jgi:hypothetical protein